MSGFRYHDEVFTTIKKLFQRKALPAAPEAQPRVLPAPAPAPAPLEPDPFDDLWALLTAPEAPMAPGLLPEEEDQVQALVPRVLAHFSRNQPDPTSFPALAVQIMDLLGNPEVDGNRLLQAISPDPAICLHVLRAANSALYSRGGEIVDMRSAVLRIGLLGVGEIASGVAGRSLFDMALRVEYELFGNRWNALFLDTMAVAFWSSQFAFEQQMGHANRAFQAGMFHDIGKPLALRSLASLVLSGEVAAPIPDAVVNEVLERVHVEVGVRLHHLWGLPDHLADVCLHHHDPEVPPPLENQDLHTLRLATGLHRLIQDPTRPERLDELRQSIRATNLVRRNVKHLHTQMARQVDRVKVLFPT